MVIKTTEKLIKDYFLNNNKANIRLKHSDEFYSLELINYFSSGV